MLYFKCLLIPEASTNNCKSVSNDFLLEAKIFSGGAIIVRLNMGAVNGDMNDPILASFNGKGTSFEADFGAAYTYNDRLIIQGTLPNLVSHF